jgi:hypothetical protein
MRRLTIAAAAGLFVVMVPLVASAMGGNRLQARLGPVGESSVRGIAAWADASEQTPMVLWIRGATGFSSVQLKVCGATVNSETGAVYDQCWATFTDPDRHLTNVVVDGDGRAKAELYPKLGIASTVLLKVERVELYAGGAPEPIAVGELRGRANAGRGPPPTVITRWLGMAQAGFGHAP